MTLTTIVTFLNKSEAELKNIAVKNNYQGYVLISNQCSTNRQYSFTTQKATIDVYESTERGVSLARNKLAALVKTDLVTFADDDIAFCDNLQIKIEQGFAKFPNADIIRFNAISLNKDRPNPLIDFEGKLTFRDLTPFGAWALFIRTDFLKRNAIVFDEKCGPGTPIIHGEDTIYLHALTKRTKQFYQIRENALTIEQENSTWFNAKEEDQIKADGYMFSVMFGLWAKPLGYYHLLRAKHKKIYKVITWRDAKKQFKIGVGLSKHPL